MSSENSTFNDPLNAGNPQPVDLAGRYFNVLPDVFPNLLNAGDSFSVDIAIQNSGDFSTDSFEVYFYLSKDGKITGNDLFLGSRTLDGLNAASFLEFSQTLTIPTNGDNFWDGDGKYYIGMVIDPRNLLRESNEQNNSNIGLLLDYDEITVGDTQKPDLTGKSFDLNKSVINVGDSFNLTFDIANLGGSTKDPFNVTFYLSNDKIIDKNSDPILRTITLDPLTAKSSTDLLELTQDLVLPGVDSTYWRGDGTYYVGMKIDSDNRIAESNESNNIRWDDLIVNNTQRPDLTAKDFDLTKSIANAGDSLNINFDVANLGGTTNAPFNVSFYLSKDDILDSSDKELLFTTIDGLAGKSSTGPLVFNQDFSLPGVNDSFWSGDGKYYVFMKTDSGNDVRESNETNNLSIDSIIINNTQLADLTAKKLDVNQSSLNAGDTFNLTFDILNQGGATQKPFNVSFYLSSDKFIGGADDRHLRTITLDPLQANSSTDLLKLTEDLILPGINDSFWEQGNGTYYVGMLIDSGDHVPEINERNNAFVDSVVINNTILRGTRGNDDLFGSVADDILWGDRGDDDLWGNRGNDSLYGERGDDNLYGGSGDDYLHGGAGDDYLWGVNTAASNPGDGEIDILIGGYGADVFFLGDQTQAYYDSLSLKDYAVIADFDIREDFIVLHGQASDYRLGASLSNTPDGIAIYDRNDETIGIIQGNNLNNLNLTAGYFEYV
jgi:hypothetical protein